MNATSTGSPGSRLIASGAALALALSFIAVPAPAASASYEVADPVAADGAADDHELCATGGEEARDLDRSEIARSRAAALRDQEVRALRQHLRDLGFRPSPSHDFGQAWAEGSVLHLTYRSDDPSLDAVIGVVDGEDGQRTVEAATLRLQDDELLVDEQWKVENGQIAPANSYFQCMLSCYGVQCARHVRTCSMVRFPSAVLACLAAACAAQTRTCNAVCR